MADERTLEDELSPSTPASPPTDESWGQVSAGSDTPAPVSASDELHRAGAWSSAPGSASPVTASELADGAAPQRPARRAMPEEANASVRAEQARLRAEREARRAAREAAIRPLPGRPDPVAVAGVDDLDLGEPAPRTIVRERVVTRRSTDSFLPSLSLFILRLIVAVILGIRGVSVLLDLQTTTDLIATTVLPVPAVLAIVLGAAEIAIAVALVFGLLTRVAGLGVTTIGVSALAFVLWGPWSPFVAGQPGFTGELELLLAAVGFLFVAVGGGAWGLDHGFRVRRSEDGNDDDM